MILAEHFLVEMDVSEGILKYHCYEDVVNVVSYHVKTSLLWKSSSYFWNKWHSDARLLSTTAMMPRLLSKLANFRSLFHIYSAILTAGKTLKASAVFILFILLKNWDRRGFYATQDGTHLHNIYKIEAPHLSHFPFDTNAQQECLSMVKNAFINSK